MDTEFGRVRAAVAAAIRPSLTEELAAFESARTALAATRPVPTTVAVVGLTPGEGRTSVAALLALVVSGWSDRRITVLDAVAAPGARRDPVNGVAGVRDTAGRSVTSLLAGDIAQGRLAALVDDSSRPTATARDRGQTSVLAAKAQDVVRRARIRSALTPGTAVPVLSLPAGRMSAGFPPQDLERAIARLAFRSDLVIVDTPAGPTVPVLHAALRHADQLIGVVRGDGDVDARLHALRQWAATAPGGNPDRPLIGVVVQRGLRRPRWTDPGHPVLLLGRDEGLRRRSVGRISRRTVTTGLDLAAAVARTAERSHGLVLAGPGAEAAAGSANLMGTPPHLGGLREPVRQH